jgi:hypothetical protein
VKTDGDQTVGGVKTFTATDVHSQGITVTGTSSRVMIDAGTYDDPTKFGNMKVNLGRNRSGVEAGAGGDLSLVLYDYAREGVYDVGLGFTSDNALNIKNGLAGSINHFCRLKNVCQMTDNGMNNVVLIPQQIAGSCTAATEIGVKAYRPNVKWVGLEFRGDANSIFQMICHTEAGTASANTIQIRTSGDNGQSWSSWIYVLTSESTGWV